MFSSKGQIILTKVYQKFIIFQSLLLWRGSPNFRSWLKGFFNTLFHWHILLTLVFVLSDIITSQRVVLFLISIFADILFSFDFRIQLSQNFLPWLLRWSFSLFIFLKFRNVLYFLDLVNIFLFSGGTPNVSIQFICRTWLFDFIISSGTRLFLVMLFNPPNIRCSFLIILLFDLTLVSFNIIILLCHWFVLFFLNFIFSDQFYLMYFLFRSISFVFWG